MKGIGRTFKRGDIWWFAYSHRGAEYKCSSHTDSQAVAKRMLNAAIKKLGNLGYNPDEERLTFEQMIERLILHRQVNNQRSHDAGQRMVHLRPFFEGMRAPEITTEAVERYKVARLAEAAKPATVNRELALLRRAFKVCEVSRMPRFTLLPEDNVRQDFLDPPDFARVREHLPAEFRDFFSFLYLSGWRQGQVAALEWRDVDLARGELTARAETTKGGVPHTIPLVGELREIIDRARGLRLLDCPYVFHHRHELHFRDKHRPLSLRGSKRPLRKAWNAACAVAGFAGHVPHCLRRSGIRNMIQIGKMSPQTAKKWSGHKTDSTLFRYNIITTDDMRREMEVAMTRLNENQTPSRVRAIR